MANKSFLLFVQINRLLSLVKQNINIQFLPTNLHTSYGVVGRINDKIFSPLLDIEQFLSYLLCDNLNKSFANGKQNIWLVLAKCGKADAKT